MKDDGMKFTFLRKTGPGSIWKLHILWSKYIFFVNLQCNLTNFFQILMEVGWVQYKNILILCHFCKMLLLSIEIWYGPKCSNETQNELVNFRRPFKAFPAHHTYVLKMIDITYLILPGFLTIYFQASFFNFLLFLRHHSPCFWSV